MLNDRKKLFALPLLLLFIANSIAVAQAPDGYYKNAEGKNKQNLLNALCKIVGPHTNVGYDGLWEVYEESDVRPGTNYYWDMYSTSKFIFGQNQCGNYKNVGDCVNREHSFPKSWFNNKNPMASDAFHIYPTDGKVNGQRSNNPYGECANGTTLPSHNGVKALGKLGKSTFPGYSGTVFEPDDEYKGDFARTYFYMAACYNDKIAGWSSPMLAGNNYPCYTTWAVNLLIKWNEQDPVSEKEINRNNAVYKFQKNRNPFIDHPELADYIWGELNDKGWIPGGSVEPDPTKPSIKATVSSGTLDFYSVPQTASEPATVDITTQNVTDAITVTITGEFQISSDKSNWKKQLTVGSDGGEIYVRMPALAEGSYSGTLSANSPTVKGFSLPVSGTVSATASFFEDFENGNAVNNYSQTSYDGSACKWTFSQAGICNRDNQDKFNGNQGVCFGKNAGYIAMAENKFGGIGTVSFFAAPFKNDDATDLELLYSTDNGSNWTLIKTINIEKSSSLNEYRVSASVPQPARIKISKTSGERINIDDISITDYSASVTGITSDSGVRAYAKRGAIVVETELPTHVTIFSLDAKPVFNATISGNTTIPAAQGFYIITTADHTQKLIVR